MHIYVCVMCNVLQSAEHHKGVCDPCPQTSDTDKPTESGGITSCNRKAAEEQAPSAGAHPTVGLKTNKNKSNEDDL